MSRVEDVKQVIRTETERTLKSIAADDLIAELTRRNRVRVITNTTGYFAEIAEDDRYMASVEHELVRGITRELNNKLWVKVDDTVTARDAEGRPQRMVRKATLTVITPDGVYADETA